MEAFQELLRETARDLGTPGYDTACGWGLLNMGRLLAHLLGDTAYEAISQARLMADPAALVLLAAYDKQGKMLYLTRSEGEETPLPPEIPEAVRWKIFTLDPETLCPLRDAVVT